MKASTVVIPGHCAAMSPEPMNPDHARKRSIVTAVFPAEAGIHLSVARTVEPWAPAFAGVTVRNVRKLR